MKRKINIKIILYCFIISLIMLFFTSKSSPFYPFNDWVDVNAFMTMGRGMMKGLIPYKDLFEQKGPFLYLLFGLCSLISDSSYIGVFILEVLCMTGTLYFCYLISIMFLSKRKCLLLLPIYLLLMVTSASFTHGSSCEEFMFLPQAISLYYLVRHFKGIELSYKEYTVNGLMAGIVLLMKYTSLGYWMAFMLIILFLDFKNKKYRHSILASLFFLLGMVLPFIGFLIYFGLNNGINEFFHVYFIVNMTAYGDKVSIIERILKMVWAFLVSLRHNNFIVIILVLLYPVIVWFLDLSKKGKIALIFLYLLSSMGIFYGLKSFLYYILPINFLMIISLIGLFSKIHLKKDKYFPWTFIIVLVLCFGGSYFLSVNKDFHQVSKEDLFQYHFAEIIKKDSNATMVNIGFLDCGVYMMSNLLPSTYYFELQNFSYENYPDNIDAFRDYIKNKKTTYIVYVKKNKNDSFLEEDELYQNYDIIKQEDFVFEKQFFEAFLWKVKE